MIIGFEAKRLYQNLSGLGNYSRNTVRSLAKYYPENKYVLFVPKLSNLFCAEEPIAVVEPKSGFSKRFRFYWRLAGVYESIGKNKIAVFHGLSHILPFGLKRLGIPSIVTIHDLIFLRFPDFYKKIDRKLYYLQTRSSCHRATKILAISHQTKKDLIDFLHIDPKKIVVIHQACDRRFYEQVDEETKSAIRQKFDLPDRFILCVGTIESRKNQLAILKGVVSEKLSIPVVILGKPTPYKYKLDEFIAESNIRKQLIFLHNTDTTELQAIYQMAEIMIYPSYFEGFGLPVLEAQASGCPVITSNVSSMPEAGGDGAIYINPDNSTEIGRAIHSILSNDDLKRELISKGRKNASHFSDQVVSEKLMDLYLSMEHPQQ